MRSNRRFIIISLIVIVVLVSYGSFSIFYLSPKKEEIESLKKNIETEQAIVESLTEKFENLQQPSFNQEELVNQLPATSKIDQILLDLAKVEKRTQSQIETFIIRENLATELQNIYKVTFDLQVTSKGYEEFIRFLSELQNLPRINQIETLNFQSTTAGDAFLFSLSISMFYYPQIEEEILQESNQ